MRKKLTKSRVNRMIFGVCGGLGEYLEFDITVLRIIAILAVFFGGFGIPVYLILALIMPYAD